MKNTFLISVVLVFVASGCYSFKLGSFNIENWGPTKTEIRLSIRDALVQIISRYDVVAIQELSNKPDTGPGVCGENTADVICTFMDVLNTASPKTYGFGITPYASNEQYVLIYDSSLFTLIDAIPSQVQDIFARPPMIAHLTHIESGKDFYIVNVHTSPPMAGEEIAHLGDLVITENIQDSRVAIVGDLNADSGCGCGFREDTDFDSGLFTKLPGWKNFIGNDQDTTVAVSSNTYDRIILSPSLAQYAETAEGTVYRFNNTDLAAIKQGGCNGGWITAGCPSSVTDREAQSKISDHFPVDIDIEFSAAVSILPFYSSIIQAFLGGVLLK